MKVFRDLYITANAETMAAAVAAMESTLPPGWTREREAEKRSQAFQATARRAAYCFARKQDPKLPAAMLIVALKDPETDPGTFHVSNIVPVDRHQLDHAEYNALLEDFYQRVFKPYAESSDLEYTLTGAEAGLEQWMDSTTADLLREFSAGANKGTGASHPSDRKRWNAFLLAAHQTGSRLDASTLARWLVEAEDWSPEIAEQLALEYESGLELLSYASSH